MHVQLGVCVLHLNAYVSMLTCAFIPDIGQFNHLITYAGLISLHLTINQFINLINQFIAFRRCIRATITKAAQHRQITLFSRTVLGILMPCLYSFHAFDSSWRSARHPCMRLQNMHRRGLLTSGPRLSECVT